MITLVNLVLLPSSQRKSRSLVYSVWGEITLGWIFFDFFWQDVDRESVSCPGGIVISSKWGRNLWEISLENSRLLKCHSILLNIRIRSLLRVIKHKYLMLSLNETSWQWITHRHKCIVVTLGVYLPSRKSQSYKKFLICNGFNSLTFIRKLVGHIVELNHT